MTKNIALVVEQNPHNLDRMTARHKKVRVVRYHPSLGNGLSSEIRYVRHEANGRMRILPAPEEVIRPHQLSMSNPAVYIDRSGQTAEKRTVRFTGSLKAFSIWLMAGNEFLPGADSLELFETRFGGSEGNLVGFWSGVFSPDFAKPENSTLSLAEIQRFAVTHPEWADPDHYSVVMPKDVAKVVPKDEPKPSPKAKSPSKPVKPANLPPLNVSHAGTDKPRRGKRAPRTTA